MNFVAQVEEKLRELGWEARKKYPGVKEASERATLQLRTLQNKYVAAVRHASSDNSIKHPTTAMFQSEDILRPFLWAGNYPDINHTILTIVLNALQLLIDGDAIDSGDIIHVLRILSIHAHGCTYTLNHAAGATTVVGLVAASTTTNTTTTTSVGHTVPPVSSSVSTNTPSSTTGTGGGTGGIGSAILSSVSGMGSAMFSGFKGTSSTIAHAASGALSMSIHGGGGYSSSTGHASGHHRSWKEEEMNAQKILQLLLRILDSRGYDLAEDIYTASIHITMILLATDSILPMDFLGTGTGGGGGSSNTKGGGTKLNHHSNHSFTSIEGGSSTGPLQAARTVRRAAATTLRQMISILFEKAIKCKDTSSLSTSTNKSQDSIVTLDESFDELGITQIQKPLHTTLVDAAARYNLQFLAYRTLQDIMRLIFTNYIDEQEDMNRPGPLSQAFNGFFGHKIYPPPRSACMDLIVMILRQRVDLFTTSLFSYSAFDESHGPIHLELDFALLLRHQLCPRIIHHLNLDRSAWTGADRKSLDTMSFFSVFLWFIKLIATIIELYGHSNHAKAVDDAILSSGASTTMENESKRLLSCLTQFVVDASEKIRDTGTFEDGFIYMGIDDEDSEGDYVSDFSIPFLIYWRASVCLEFFYSLFSERREIFYSLDLIHTLAVGEIDFFSLITTAAADFATASASCNRGILSMVRFCESETIADPLISASGTSKGNLFFEHLGDFAIHRIYPTIIAKSREFLKSFDEWSTVEELTNSATNRIRSISEASTTSTKLSDQLERDAPHGIICNGETTWVAFNCILLLAEFLSSFRGISDETVKQELITKSCSFFIPSLAILQHFIRRFPGSHFVMRTALSGYILLANTCFPLRYESEFHRKVLLGSLSSLSLTSASKSNSQSAISDQQLLSLTALLYITHLNHDNLEEDWFLVLSTLDRAMNVIVSRTEEENEWTRSLSSCICRLAQFSSCFSAESLIWYFDALSILYRVEEESSGPDVLVESKVPSYDSSASKRDLGKGIFFARGLPSETSTKNLKLLGWAFFDHAYEKLASSKLTKSYDTLRSLPFSLVLLSLSMVENSFRLHTFHVQIVNYWNELLRKSDLSEIRSFSLDMLSNLASLGLSISRMPIALPSTSLIDVSSIDELFLVSTNQDLNNLQNYDLRPPREQLIAPLCQTLRTTCYRDIAEGCLASINSVLEVAGHDIPAKAWVSVIDALSSASGGLKDYATDDIDRTSSSWAPICNMAFRCLKLIVDDYLNDLLALSDSVGLSPRSALLDCCAAFGSSEHDVNTSLTASGMLWTIADRDTTAFSLHHVMSKLAVLATDKRQEVRNCSVNTLFSCIVGLGQSFTTQQWRESIESTTFGIIDIINANAFENNEISTNDKIDPDKERYKVTRHHSRDSLSKQWIGTLILALRGWDRILRLFFNKLLTLGSTPFSLPSMKEYDSISGGYPDESHNDSILWLDKIWSRTLDWAYSCSIRIGGRDTVDLRMVSTDLLILCAQISSEYGIQAIVTPARVGTNMQVVNGALRSVREANASTQNAIYDVDLSDDAKRKKSTLFVRAFTVLMRYEIFLKDEEAMSLEIESVTTASTLFVETGLFNLLTKLSQGLSKLYECCKQAELSTNAETNVESGFLDLVLLILRKAAGPQRAKYINQAQRVCLDLLQVMASQSSSLALEKLTAAAGSAFFRSMKEKQGYEFVEMDAAHIICEVLKKATVTDNVKVCILEKIIEIFNTQSLEEIDRTYRDYGLTATLFNDTLKSLRGLEKKQAQDSDSFDVQMEYIDHVWSKVYSFYEKILSTDILVSDPPKNVDDLVELMSILSDFSPWRKREQLEILLSKTALDLAIQETEFSESLNAMRIHLFRTAYTELSTLLPYSNCLQTISSAILSKAVDYLKTISATNETIAHYYIDVSISMCRVICAMPDASPLAASVYSQICILLNSDNALIRNEASNVLSKIGVASILHRQEEMQDEMRRLEKITDEHETVIRALEKEKIRADAAEAQILILMEENRKLKERNSELQRQVSMLCDGSIL